MTRQIAEISARQHGARFHITSLKPIRPGNKPADWENDWLKTFEEGVKEQGGFFEDGANVSFRYMAPLVTNTSCLKCHAEQGYEEGDIRGESASFYLFPADALLAVNFGLCHGCRNCQSNYPHCQSFAGKKGQRTARTYKKPAERPERNKDLAGHCTDLLILQKKSGTIKAIGPRLMRMCHSIPMQNSVTGSVGSVWKNIISITRMMIPNISGEKFFRYLCGLQTVGDH